MQKYDVIIVGAGIAGMTAAIYVKRAGRSVLLIEEKVCGGQIINTLNIGNWPGEAKISGTDLSNKILAQVKELDVDIRYEEVVNVREGFVVKTDEAEYGCSALIIATGTEPRRLSEKQEKDAGRRPISYCATCDGALYKDKKVVVVGSGNTAKHEMQYLSNICSEVYHIHHDDPIPEDAEAVFVAIGREPMTKIFGDLVDLDKEGYVVAGENCHSSLEGVFVAGDCRTKDLRQLVTAASDGAMAASEAVKYLG